MARVERWRCHAVVASIVTALVASQPAQAEDPKARASQLFHEASSAYDHGQFATAARGFEESDRLAPRGAALYNAALAWEAAGDPARAAENYERAIARADLSVQQTAGARQQLTALSRKLGALDVRAPAEVRVAVGVMEGAGPHAHFYVEPGRHDVRITWPDGKTETRTLDVSAGASEMVTVDQHQAALPHGEAGNAPPSSQTAPPSSTASPSRARSPADTRPLRTAGWVVLGGSVVFAGTAVFLGLETLHARDAFEASGETSIHSHDEAVRYRLLTNVAWACTAASAAVGGTLFALSLRRTGSAASAHVGIAPAFGSIAVRAHF
jgi:hypothetical protein